MSKSLIFQNLISTKAVQKNNKNFLTILKKKTQKILMRLRPNQSKKTMMMILMMKMKMPMTQKPLKVALFKLF